MKKGKPVQPTNANQQALLSAYERLKSGVATIAVGLPLTIENVAIEAGVSRSTAYRCADLAAKFPHRRQKARQSPEEVDQPTSGERELRLMLKRACNRIILLEKRLAQALSGPTTQPPDKVVTLRSSR